MGCGNSKGNPEVNGKKSPVREEVSNRIGSAPVQSRPKHTPVENMTIGDVAVDEKKSVNMSAIANTPIPEPINLISGSSITVHVTPASREEVRDEEEGADQVCQSHQTFLESWCSTCAEPVCPRCLEMAHPPGQDHLIVALSDVQEKLRIDLGDDQAKLKSLLDELKPLQEEALRWRQIDEEQAHELVLAKQRACTEIEAIGQHMQKAGKCLQRSETPSQPLNFYQGLLQTRAALDSLNGLPEKLRCISEGYRVCPIYGMQVDQEFVPAKDTIYQAKYNKEKDVLKRLQRFNLAEIFRANYTFLKSKSKYNGSLTISMEFEHSIEHNPDLKKNEDNMELQNKEFKRLLRKFLHEVTMHNAHFKASCLTRVFHIRLGNVGVISDTILDIAMSSEDHCSALACFITHVVGGSAKGQEWHFLAETIPTSLMDRCQEELNRDIYAAQRRLEDEGDQALPSHDDSCPKNHRIWRRFKCFVRFVGELYTCGLVPGAFLDFFLESLLNRHDEAHHYRECVCIMLLTVGAILDSNSTTQIQMDEYLQMLENKQKSKPDIYIQHLIQYVEALRQSHWNLKECSGIAELESMITSQQTDIILDYLNSIEMVSVPANQPFPPPARASLSANSCFHTGTNSEKLFSSDVRKRRISSSQPKDDLTELLDAYEE